MRRRVAGGKVTKTQRRKSLGLHNTAKVAGRHKFSAVDAATRIALLTRERDEALEQQSATSEVLRIIAKSPQSVQPVFEAIVANVAHLCDATFSAVAQFTRTPAPCRRQQDVARGDGSIPHCLSAATQPHLHHGSGIRRRQTGTRRGHRS